MQRTPHRWSRCIPSLVLILAVPMACEDDVPTLLDPGAAEADALVAAGASPGGAPGLGSLGAVTTVASFDAFSGQLPESIAVDRFGNMYVSMPGLGEIWKLDPAGSFQEVVATFPLQGLFGVSGLRFDVRDNLFAVNASDHVDARGVWKISSTGEKERIAGTDVIPGPNDVAISPDGTLFITDSPTGAVWRVLPVGQAEVWVQDPTLEGTGAYGLPIPIGANGIVLVPGRKVPFARGSGHESVGGVVVSNAEKGQVVYVPILPDGRAGQPTVLIANPALLFGIDGITMDARGTIYGAVNAGNRVVRISSDGSDVSEIVSGPPLDFPTGIAFGTGREGHTLFIASSAIIHFLSDPPMPGNANPSVVAVRVGPPGLSNR